MARPTLENRLEGCQIPVTRKLFKIMIEKKTNLCVAADFSSFDQIVRFIDKVGPHIAVLKTHCERYSGDLSKNLAILYKKKKHYNFLLFEDRKFGDGEDVVGSIYESHYARYADLVTLYPLGDGIFKAIRFGVKSVGLADDDDEPRGCLAVCDLSFEGAPNDCALKYLAIAEKNTPVCAGIISQTLTPTSSSMIKATPGVHLEKRSDGKNQQWRHPRDVIATGTDLIIVGRGITSLPEDQWLEKTLQYKEICWEGYLASIKE